MAFLLVAFLLGVAAGIASSPALCVAAAGVISLVTYGFDARRRSHLVSGGYWKHFGSGVSAAGWALLIFTPVIAVGYGIGALMS